MSVQKTDRVLKCYRIGDPDGAFPIYDAEGARLYPGRWNTHTSPVIYTSEHYSTALLEKLVHANLVMPANQHFIEITIPNGVSYEIFQTAAHPGWDSRNGLQGVRAGVVRGEAIGAVDRAVNPGTAGAQLSDQPGSPGRQGHRAHFARAGVVGRTAIPVA